MIEAFAVDVPDPNHRWVKLSRMDARRWAVYWALELRRAQLDCSGGMHPRDQDRMAALREGAVDAVEI